MTVFRDRVARSILSTAITIRTRNAGSRWPSHSLVICLWMCTLVEKWTLTGLRAHHLGASTDPEQRRGNTGRYPMSSDKKRNEYDFSKAVRG
jgi:hypothetical protein